MKKLFFISGSFLRIPYMLINRKKNILKEKNNAWQIIRELLNNPSIKESNDKNKFIVILENHGREDTVLPEPAHGICIYMVRNNKRYLLDTGPGEVIIKNALNLGIELKDIDKVFISHGHYDHGGGLSSLLKINKKVKVYLSPKALEDKHYAKIAGIIKKNISLEDLLIDNYQERLVTVDDFIEIDKDIFIIPQIIKTFPLPPTNSNLFKQTKGKGKMFADNFDHEQLLVIRDNDGLIVYSGCCHSGVLNVVSTVNEYFPGEVIKAFIGGFHLINPVLMKLGEKKSEVFTLGKKMQESNVLKFITGHCTSVEGYLLLKEILGDKIDYFYTGKNFIL